MPSRSVNSQYLSSRHGELNRTIGLLEDVVAKQPLSPMAFSQSVHNISSGIYGILSTNKDKAKLARLNELTNDKLAIDAYAWITKVL